jgi:hypothetical protein
MNDRIALLRSLRRLLPGCADVKFLIGEHGIEVVRDGKREEYKRLTADEVAAIRNYAWGLGGSPTMCRQRFHELWPKTGRELARLFDVADLVWEIAQAKPRSARSRTPGRPA